MQASYCFGLLVGGAGLLAASHQSLSQQSAEPDAERITNLVLASHILVNEGVMDSFGHVSVRSAKNPNHFFIPKAMPPGSVTADDLVEMDFDARPIDPKAPRVNGERFIHSEIYKARPDVQSVIHTHSAAVLPFGLANVPLRPVIAQAGFLPLETPLFEIREAFGAAKERGMLVRSGPLGASLAKKLGNSPVVLMRGHGNTIVGGSAKEATVRAIYTDINARAQFAAMQLSKNIAIMDAAELAYNSIENFDMDRPWENFRRRLEATIRR
jgi:ribulose-5-phosphate 4-epimerase/fuculose-1-phosphate aldolase